MQHPAATTSLDVCGPLPLTPITTRLLFRYLFIRSVSFLCWSTTSASHEQCSGMRSFINPSGAAGYQALARVVM